MALEFPQDGWQMPKNRENESSAEGEFFILMSLALDGMLSDDEESRFHRYMEQDSTLANEWQTWQDLNTQFDDEPAIMPPANFVESITERLAMQESADEVRILMSLAADGLLSADEESRFHRYMEQDPLLANEWQVWQDLSIQFNNEPSMVPPAGFVESVAARVVLQERRSKLRLGLVVGAATTFAWLLLVLALVGGGVYAIMYQGAWLNEQIINLTSFAVVVTDWLSIVSRDAGRIFNANYYQMWGMALGYVAASGLILLFWTRLLRRSVGQAAAS